VKALFGTLGAVAGVDGAGGAEGEDGGDVDWIICFCSLSLAMFSYSKYFDAFFFDWFGH
jgi:hypothetical protein